MDHATDAHVLMGAFERTLDMRVKVDFSGAQEFVRALASYNEFNGLAAAEMLNRIDKIIPRAVYADVNGKPNVNNGIRTYSIEIGRESSPVIYLRRYIYVRDQPLSLWQIYAIETAARVAQADEVSYRYERNGEAQCRFNDRIWKEKTTTDPALPSSLPNIGEEEFRFWWD